MSKQRPRSQAIEDEAERAIGEFLSQWAINKCDKDYGRDLHVELFTATDATSDPSSTGLLFDIQIKATDATKPSKPKHKFRVKDLHYYQQNALPVLLCLYYGQDKTIYSRWAPTINIKSGQITQTVYFEDDDWGQHPSIQTLLSDDLEWIRSLASHTALPYTVYIEDPRLAQILEDYWIDTHVLQVTSVPPVSDLRPTIRAKDNHLYIDCGVASFSFHLDNDNLAIDITTAVAIMLLKEGYDGQAAALFKKVLTASARLSPNMLWLFGNDHYHNLHTIYRRMLFCDQIEILCRLLRCIYLSSPSVDDARQTYIMLKPDKDGNIDFGDMTRYTDAQHLVLRDIVDDCSTMEMAHMIEHISPYLTIDHLSEVFDDWSELSHAALCWLSESYLKLGDIERSIEALCAATDVGNIGIGHPVVRRLGGMILSVKGRADDAIHELDCSYHLGDMQSRLLSIIVLIEHGQYSEAINRMATTIHMMTTIATEDDPNAYVEDIIGADADELFLLSLVMDHITRTSGVMHQNRDTRRAIDATHALAGPFSTSKEQYVEYFDLAFDADIVWGSVWFNHAAMRQAQLPLEASLSEAIALDYLSAAMLCYIDTEAWVCAIAALLNLTQLVICKSVSSLMAAELTASRLLEATIRTAIRLMGPTITETLHRIPVIDSLNNPTDSDFSVMHISTAITQDSKDALTELLARFVDEPLRGQGFLWMWPTLLSQRLSDADLLVEELRD